MRVDADTPNIRAVRPGNDLRLVITWRGGAESVVDVSRHILEYAIFAPLRLDDDLFQKVEVGEWGWCVHWSDDMEISADVLWPRTRTRCGVAARVARSSSDDPS
jgi:Protein of unknown function (DUF2442)